MIFEPLNQMPQSEQQMLRCDGGSDVFRCRSHKLCCGACGDVLTDNAKLRMCLDKLRHPFLIEARLSILLRIKVIWAAQGVLLTVNAKNDAAFLHGFEDFTADQIIHGQAMLSIGSSVRWVIFACF